MLQSEPNRATYGWTTVQKANDQAGIEILMVSDDLFRSQDIATRKKYIQLVESAKGNGTEVQIFSSLHVSGAQLSKLTGLAAILRFPMPQLEEGESEDTDDDDDDDDENKHQKTDVQKTKPVQTGTTNTKHTQEKITKGHDEEEHSDEDQLDTDDDNDH